MLNDVIYRLLLFIVETVVQVQNKITHQVTETSRAAQMVLIFDFFYADGA